MKFNKLEARLTTLSKEQQEIADTNSNPPDFQFCGVPEIYFEGTIPSDWFINQTDDEIAVRIGKEFINQIREKNK